MGATCCDVGLFLFGLAVFKRDVRDSSDCDEPCETQEIIMGLDGDGRNGYHRGDDYGRFDDGDEDINKLC